MHLLHLFIFLYEDSLSHSPFNNIDYWCSSQFIKGLILFQLEFLTFLKKFSNFSYIYVVFELASLWIAYGYSFPFLCFRFSEV